MRPQDPLADANQSNSLDVYTESRQKLYGSARVPERMEIEYPEFPGSPAHALRVLTTSRRGGKLHIEFTIGNLDIEGCASPQPPM